MLEAIFWIALANQQGLSPQSQSKARIYSPLPVRMNTWNWVELGPQKLIPQGLWLEHKPRLNIFLLHYVDQAYTRIIKGAMDWRAKGSFDSFRINLGPSKIWQMSLEYLWGHQIHVWCLSVSKKKIMKAIVHLLCNKVYAHFCYMPHFVTFSSCTKHIYEFLTRQIRGSSFFFFSSTHYSLFPLFLGANIYFSQVVGAVFVNFIYTVGLPLHS